MGRVTARITVPGPAHEAERLWYDLKRWPSFIDGFAHLVATDGEWPHVGSRLAWESVPGGRGKVVERVMSYEPRVGQTLAVEDPKLKGAQRIEFIPGADECQITLSLEYSMRDDRLHMQLVDVLFNRRPMTESLMRTLQRFAIELRSERDA